MPINGEYRGEKQTIVTRFTEWNDRIGQLGKRAEKFGAMVTVTKIPDQGLADWLENYRKSASKPETTQGQQANGDNANGNGKASKRKPANVAS